VSPGETVDGVMFEIVGMLWPWSGNAAAVINAAERSSPEMLVFGKRKFILSSPLKNWDLASCAQHKLAAARIIARVVPRHRGGKTPERIAGKRHSTWRLSAFLRGRSAFSATMFRLFHQLACNRAAHQQAVEWRRSLSRSLPRDAVTDAAGRMGRYRWVRERTRSAIRATQCAVKRRRSW